MLEPNDKILAVHRRLFPEDHSRFFLGVVEEYLQGVAKVTGYTWVVEPYKGTFVRKSLENTRLLALASGTLLVYQLPAEFDIEKAEFRLDDERGVHLTDGRRPVLDLTEGQSNASRHVAP